MEILRFIVITFGGAALLISAAGWLASKFIENRLNRDIESYKLKIKAESDIAIENLKSRLQVAAKEREITVTWLHEKRAASIESLYAALVDLHLSIRSVLSVFSPRKPAEIRKYSLEAFNRSRDVQLNYLKAKIFLAPVTCEKIELVINILQQAIDNYYIYLPNYADHELESLEDVKDSAWKEMSDSVPPALNELEAEFRYLLGVEHTELKHDGSGCDGGEMKTKASG